MVDQLWKRWGLLWNPCGSNKRFSDVCIFLEKNVLHMFWLIKTRQALDLGWDEVALMLFAVLSVDDREFFSRHYIIYLTTVNP